nr:RNA-directed DNA polymerase, eukaryota, reverse transcriptase zinc-binding domain protein [Tanacetum cinerariifolium]
MKRTCYASSAITYMRAPLESLSFVAPTANWGLDKRQRGLDLCLIGSLYCWQFIASKIKLSKLSMARPPPGVCAAKQSEVNDEPVKTKLASFIMGQRRPRIVLLSLISSNMGGGSFLKFSLSKGTLTGFLFQDCFYQLAKRIQHENQRLLSNPYPIWSKRDVPSVGPTDYLSLPSIISQADNHQLVEGTAHPKFSGSSSITSSITDSRECLAKIKVEDLVRSGLWFTSNKSSGRTTDGLLKKLDRVLSNFGFVEKFSNANAQFLPFVVSDHSPSVLVIPSRNLHVSSLLVCYLVIWNFTYMGFVHTSYLSRNTNIRNISSASVSSYIRPSTLTNRSLTTERPSTHPPVQYLREAQLLLKPACLLQLLPAKELQDPPKIHDL